MRRVFDPENPELMDRPQPVSAALERDLENLRGLNRWFGAWRIVRRVLGPALRRDGRSGQDGSHGQDGEGSLLRIVDLCSGSGDLPRLMVQLGKRHGVRVEVEAVEGHPATFEIGRRFCQDTPGVKFVQADARAWEPAEKPDWIVCSLALHHFTESDAVTILRRMREFAKHGVLVADLERAWWAAAGIYSASVFYREPMTVEDMRRSAKAAFSWRELRELAEAAGWRDIRRERFWYGRQALWEHLAGN